MATDKFGGVLVEDEARDKFGGVLIEEPPTKPRPAADALQIKLNPYEEAELKAGGKPETYLSPTTDFMREIGTRLPADILRARSAISGLFPQAPEGLQLPQFETTAQVAPYAPPTPESVKAEEKLRFAQEFPEHVLVAPIGSWLLKGIQGVRGESEWAKQYPQVAQWREGLEETVAENIDALTSPQNLALIVGGGMAARLGKWAAKAVASGFAYLMAKDLPEIYGQIQTELDKPQVERDQKKIASLITQGTIQLGGAGLATSGAVLAKGKPKPSYTAADVLTNLRPEEAVRVEPKLLEAPPSAKAPILVTKPPPAKPPLIPTEEPLPKVEPVPAEKPTPVVVETKPEQKQPVKPLKATAQKKFLLAEAQKALAEAPEGEVEAGVVPGENQAVHARNAVKFGTVTIEVPGDGIFNIINTKQSITEFLERAKKFPTSAAIKTGPSRQRKLRANLRQLERARRRICWRVWPSMFLSMN